MLVLLEMELIALQLKSTMNASLENTIVTHLIHALISHRVSSLSRGPMEQKFENHREHNQT